MTPGHGNYDRESASRFVESFQDNYPELCKGREITVIDCTVITNPDHDRNLRDHLGTHPKTWQQVIEHIAFLPSNAGLARLSTSKNNLIINVCKSGCHRSVAAGNSQIGVVQRNMYGGDPKGACVKIVDLQVQHHYDRKCGQCKECDPDQYANDTNRARSYEMLEQIVPYVNAELHRARREATEPRPKYHPTKKDAEKGAARIVKLDDDRPSRPHAKSMKEQKRSRSRSPVRCSPTLARTIVVPDASRIKTLLQGYRDDVTMKVIKQLFDVFYPQESIFDNLKNGPAELLIDIVNSTAMNVDQIRDMFAAHGAPTESASSSSMPGSARRPDRAPMPTPPSKPPPKLLPERGTERIITNWPGQRRRKGDSSDDQPDQMAARRAGKGWPGGHGKDDTKASDMTIQETRMIAQHREREEKHRARMTEETKSPTSPSPVGTAPARRSTRSRAEVIYGDIEPGRRDEADQDEHSRSGSDQESGSDDSYRSLSSAPHGTPLGKVDNGPREDLPPSSNWGGPENGDAQTNPSL
jgi:hypothetical protein